MGNKAKLILNGAIDLFWLESRLEGETDIYCTDGAYEAVKATELELEGIIGDMDSIESEVYPLSKLISFEGQDNTDFEKAVFYLKDKYPSIDVYCASGKQPDHFLENLSIGKKYSGQVELAFYDPGMRYFFAAKDTLLEGVKGKLISVMPFPEATGITYEGLEYPLQDAELVLGLRTGARNRAVEDKVRIRYKSGSLIIFVED
jgi:thiamine pyrophosphokinase